MKDKDNRFVLRERLVKDTSICLPVHFEKGMSVRIGYCTGEVGHDFRNEESAPMC